MQIRAPVYPYHSTFRRRRWRRFRRGRGRCGCWRNAVDVENDKTASRARPRYCNKKPACGRGKPSKNSANGGCTAKCAHGRCLRECSRGRLPLENCNLCTAVAAMASFTEGENAQPWFWSRRCAQRCSGKFLSIIKSCKLRHQHSIESVSAFVFGDDSTSGDTRVRRLKPQYQWRAVVQAVHRWKASPRQSWVTIRICR